MTLKQRFGRNYNNSSVRRRLEMTHKMHHKHGKSVKRRLKRMATAAAVGAAFITSAFMPGIAHAAAPDVNAPPDAAVQQVKSPKGVFNLQSESKIPLKKQVQAKAKVKAQAEAQAKAAAERSQQTKNPAPVNNLDKSDKQVKQTYKAEAASKAEKTSAGAPENAQKVVEVKATAYAPGAHDNDQWGDKTFLGTTVRPGIIAVDPDIIPLGSRVYVEYPDGTGYYATAEDTGGAIKGNRIDVAVSSVDKAYDFGIKNAKVYVVDQKA
jgi:3D (Asp-Asp-Asp) domain-containing protein